MDAASFIIVGENIHCTRIVKRGGTRTTELPGGLEAVTYKVGKETRHLPVPADWGKYSPSWEQGKCKHVALAIYQYLNGSGNDQLAGEDYLHYVADRQIDNGATFLDINVDEYSSDASLNGEIMAEVVKFYSSHYNTPLSIDSSNPDVLTIGLQNCRTDIRPPMVNSISLERVEAVDIVRQFNADAIVSAAGRSELPKDADGRLANFRLMVERTDQVGIPREKLHLDPLVLGVGTGDHLQGRYFLDATKAAIEEFAGVHLNGGLSNVSFGLPNRKLLNMVFIWLCIPAGTDGGIIDPASISIADVLAMDTSAEDFQLARAALAGEDEYCMNYVMTMKK